MAGPGISLVGLLQRNQGINYLRANCLFPDMRPAALLPHWQEARHLLNPNTGSPVPNPGAPEILDIPAGHEGHLTAVQASPRFANTVGNLAWRFKLVEIDALLAFQIHVETDRAAGLWAEAGGSSEMGALLRLCLPTDVHEIQPGAGCDINPDPASTEDKGSVIFESINPNMRLLAGGPLGWDDTRKVYFAGVGFGEASRLAQVARLGGRCYLKNGYHRAFQMMAEGLTHMPCVLIDLNDVSETGVKTDGSTFERRFLESANPPVCAHYRKGYEVTVRSRKRLIKLTWSQQIRFE